MLFGAKFKGRAEKGSLKTPVCAPWLCIWAEQSQGTEHAATPPMHPHQGQKAAQNKVGAQILKTSSNTRVGKEHQKDSLGSTLSPTGRGDPKEELCYLRGLAVPDLWVLGATHKQKWHFHLQSLSHKSPQGEEKQA